MVVIGPTRGLYGAGVVDWADNVQKGGRGPLLERERERALIEAGLAAAADGSASVVLFEGEAGVGKTALLRWAAQAAGERGFTVLAARAGVLERSRGFGVARQLLEGVVARATAAEKRRLLSGSAGLAARVLGVEGEGDGAGAGELGEAADLRFHHGLYWLVSNVSEGSPTALLLDDAHWCDEASLEWLIYLLSRLEGLPLAIVIAQRAGEPDTPRMLLDAIAAEPVTRVARLRALGLEATSMLVEAAYGASADPDFCRACHAWTGGNPLFVSALVAELAAEGVAPRDSSVARLREVTPPSIARATLLRLARLPADAVALARSLAVLGSVADLRVASALSGLDGERAIAAADVLVAALIVEPERPLRFNHPLVAGIVYEDIPPARRAQEHQRAARLLADAGADRDAIVAQLLRSAPTEDPWVTDVLRAGAERELAHGSPRTAATLLRRANEEPPPRALRSRVLHELGTAESLAGDAAAVETLRLALQNAPVQERAEVALALGRLLLRAGRSSEAVATLEPAIEALSPDDDDLRLRLEAALLTAARFDVRLIHLDAPRIAALGHMSAVDTHGGRLIAGQLCWGATAGGQSVAVAVELGRRALAGGRVIDEAPSTPDAYLAPILMLAVSDELEEAEAHCAHALALAKERGSAPAYSGAACIASRVAYFKGKLAEGELLARDALRLAIDRPEFEIVRGLARADLVNILVERGEVTEALEVVGDASSLPDSPLTWATDLLCAAGRAYIADQRIAEGIELLLACGQRSAEWRFKNPAWLPWRSEAALALHQLGDIERAIELCDDELWRARRYGARRPLGVALRARGLIEGGDAGLELLREAARVMRQSPAKLECGRGLVALGGALRRANRRAEARELLADGLEVADACGAVRVAEEARVELRACGASPRVLVRTGIDELTASERRVCEMAADGMSNPQIAQALFVTRATVESHLHASYRKLGLRSRNELGRALGGQINESH
jgi:DNA-binding CsgD family transcriptional regulator